MTTTTTRTDAFVLTAANTAWVLHAAHIPDWNATHAAICLLAMGHHYCQAETDICYRAMLRLQPAAVITAKA